MLTDVYQIDTARVEHYVADHLWMNLTKQFLKYDWFKKGDLIQFDGKVSEYTTSKKTDVKIERPSKVSVTRLGKNIPLTDRLINLRPLEIEQEITLQIQPFTKARDALLAFFSLNKFQILKKKWHNIQPYAIVDNQLFTRDSFREFYFTRESMIELHNLYITEKISIKKSVYNGDPIQENLLTEKDIESYLSKYKEQHTQHKKSKSQGYNN
ncbi:hypothetical protein IGI37_003104 [Enterococcus sp. AZ194]|uniref:hypothetical protein n=1 Tax=Enterococcus sp. AZ194 TaxID=2774629 RepID=UPI003F25A49D